MEQGEIKTENQGTTQDWGSVAFDATLNSSIRRVLPVEIKTKFEIPTYESDGAAGMDVKACLKTAKDGSENEFEAYDLILKPGERVLVPTGIFLAIPQGYEAQVRPRSGLALKKGITVLNSPGTIDSDYRGEVGVILINHGNEDFHIQDGDRIGQLVFNQVLQVSFTRVEELSSTQRGSGGFGSTGVK